jgi:large subunit ribosomal protein L1
MGITKKRKAVAGKVDDKKIYSLAEATGLVKEINCTKFDSSVDLHVRLGVDPKKADQAVRGTVTLPHGTGKTKKVLVLCTPDKEAEAKAAGADFVGLDEFIQKIESGWTDIDVIIAIGNNTEKNKYFTLEQRKIYLEKTVKQRLKKLEELQ